MAAPTGNLALIVTALTQGDATCAELGKRCGLPTRAVTNALHDQVKTLNPVAYRVDKVSNIPVWSRNKPPPKPRANPRIGGKYQPEFKPLTPEGYDWRDVAAMRMLTRG